MGVGRIHGQRSACAVHAQAQARQEDHGRLDAKAAAERGAPRRVLDREGPFQFHRMGHGNGLT